MTRLAAVLAVGVALCGAAWGQPVESSCYIANQRVPCSNWTGTGIVPPGGVILAPTIIQGGSKTTCYMNGRQWISPAPGRCYAADAPQQEP